jgi:hypothetical protein
MLTAGIKVGPRKRLAHRKDGMLGRAVQALSKTLEADISLQAESLIVNARASLN